MSLLLEHIVSFKTLVYRLSYFSVRWALRLQPLHWADMTRLALTVKWRSSNMHVCPFFCAGDEWRLICLTMYETGEVIVRLNFSSFNRPLRNLEWGVLHSETVSDPYKYVSASHIELIIYFYLCRLTEIVLWWLIQEFSSRTWRPVVAHPSSRLDCCVSGRREMSSVVVRSCGSMCFWLTWM